MDDIDDSPPPPLYRDFRFLAATLNCVSCVGYVIADFIRGFLDDADTTDSNVLFIALGFATLLQGIFFLLSWRQIGDSDSKCCPFAVRCFQIALTESFNFW
jgi:hypothetical protein